jgi:phosphatidylserine decarboxylase
MRLDPAGWPFVGSLVAVAVLAGWWSPWAAAVVAIPLLFTLSFFRDPERTVPDDPHAIVSPADGRIIRADRERVSIFMNVFDVHVCRTPVAGRVVDVTRSPGKFLAAMRDDASEHNERVAIVVQPPSGPPLRFVLVAGLIARRILCRVVPAATLRAGDRVGIIRFGSRVDVDLPAGASPSVAVGQRVVSGESVIARRTP